MKMSFFSAHKDEIINDTGSLADFSDVNEPNNSIKTPPNDEDLFHKMFHEHSAVMLLINPETGEIIDANIAATRFYGFDFQEKGNFFIHDINLSSPEIIEQEMDQALKFRTNYFIFNHKVSDGSIRTVEIHSSPIVLNGNKLLFSIIHDVTEKTMASNALRMNESLMKMILETTPNGVLVTDQTHDKILFINTRFQEIWPFFKSQDIYNHKASDIFNLLSETMIDDQSIFDNISPGAEKKPVNKVTVQLITGNYYKCFSACILGEDGEYDRRLFIFEDITREEIFAKSLQMAIQKEKEMNELKSGLVRMTSHEFKKPLTSILVATETIQKYGITPDDEDYAKYFYRISKNAKFMKDLIDKFLNLSKLEYGQMPIKLERANLVSFVRGWLDEFRKEQSSIRQIQFNPDCADCYLDIDINLLKQVLSNLVSNGIKYSPEDSRIVLSINANPMDVEIQVSDNGIGIPAKDQEFIFSTFFRASNVSRVPGTGIGLALVKQIIDVHDGTIGFRSKVNEGTTFTIKLPRPDSPRNLSRGSL